MRQDEARGDLFVGRGVEKKLGRYLDLHAKQIGANLSGTAVPEPGEVLFFLSQKDLNTFTLLAWFIERLGYVEDLYLTTYNINQDIIYALARLLDEERIGRLSIVISQSIMSRMPKRVEELRQVWERRKAKMRVSLCWNHSKIALLRCADDVAANGSRYVMTGSGNYSFNAYIEQYEVFCDDALYDWLLSVLEKRCFSEARMNKRHQVWGVDG